MKELKELKSFLSGELEESFRRGNINNMPRLPMAVIYMDEETRKAKEEIDFILRQTWGDRKNSIVQIAMNGNAFMDADSGEELDTEQVQERIDDMYASDNSFKDMSHLCMVFLQSTAVCTDLDEFRVNFERVHIFEEFMSDGLLSTNIIFLDESTKGKKNAAEIRSCLGSMLEEESNPYTSTFLLSNRLSNGGLLAGQRIRENYAMAGWIMVLLNGIGTGYTPELGLFYPAGREYYLTAAFSEVNRPNETICDVILHTMLTWIDKHTRSHGESRDKKFDIEDLYQRLEITGSRAGFLENFFERNIADKIPPSEALRFLPRRHPGAAELAAKDFRTADQETMGGCSALLAALPLFDGQMKDDFSEFLKAEIRIRFSAAERERAFSLSNIQEILKQLRPSEPSGKEKTDIYIREKIHADYLNWALPVIEETLKKEQKSSAGQAKEFEKILEEFQQGYFPDDTDLERYYKDITNEELSRGSSDLGERLIGSIGSKDDQREEILECLKRTAEEIFSARSVFRMPLEQEMVNRMGQNPNDIHNRIYNTLFKDLDNRIRLKTAIALSPQKQITIVNQRDENGSETELYQSIKKNVSDAGNMIYFDSCNSNTIKILRFYACTRTNLL